MAKFIPIAVTFETIDRLIKMKATDSVALYMAYSAISHWQQTYRPWATKEFMLKRLGWGDERFKNAKNILTELQLVEDIKDVDNDTGKIRGWYIQINHLVDEKTTPPRNQGGGSATGVDFDPPSTLNYHKVLSTKESAYPQIEKKKNSVKKDKQKIIDELKKNKGLQIGYEYEPDYDPSNRHKKKSKSWYANEWKLNMIRKLKEEQGFPNIQAEPQYSALKKIRAMIEGNHPMTDVEATEKIWSVFLKHKEKDSGWMDAPCDFLSLKSMWHKRDVRIVEKPKEKITDINELIRRNS